MNRDVFVTTAPLDESRPPPNQRSGIRELIQHPIFIRIIAVLYILLAFSTLQFGDTKFSLRRTLDDLSLISDTTPNFQEGYLMAAGVCLPFALIVLANSLRDQAKRGIPFFANIIFIRDIIQVGVLILILGFGYGLVQNLQENFQEGEAGLIINFNVVQRDYSVAITEGPDYQSELAWIAEVPVLQDTLQEYLDPGTNARALLSGLSNTLRAVSLALVFATILGVFLGIGLLSTNWLVRQVSVAYVEVFRNTPLLVQLFFVYRSITLVFPTSPRDAHRLGGEFLGIHFPNIFVSARGINYPKVLTTDSFIYFWPFVLIGLAVGIYLWRQRLRLMDETGTPAHTLRYFLASFLGISVIGLALAWAIGPFPLDLEEPVLGRFNFELGVGSVFTAEFLGLFLALVLYTAAFIADIVRAGIQSVPHGQIEAARAAGLDNGQTLRLVVLPQAMRLIIPPMTNQYLNLSKNSSLAIGIGYYDLYNVSTIASNQSGQVVVFFVIMLVTYLSISLLISAVMNAVNSTLQIKER